MTHRQTNETVGITAEKIICDLGNITFSAIGRSSCMIEQEIKPIIERVFTSLPKPIKYDGRGKTDFILEDQTTLSLKTNKTASKICPQIIGQTTKKKFLEYFKSSLEPTELNCKKFIYHNIDKIVSEEWNHLFSCDLLLYIFYHKQWSYKIMKKVRCPFKSPVAKYPEKNISPFTFSRCLEDWNESITLKYYGISMAEIQIHKKRNSVKFRFNMKNIIELIK